MFHNIENFGPLAAEIDPVVWGTTANFNGFHVLAALLHSTPVSAVSQTSRRWTEGATYIRQGGHHVGHWPKLAHIQVVKKTSQFKAVCKDDSAYVTQLKQQKSKRWYYLAAQRHIVNVLTSNIIFFIFAVLVVWYSHCRPYKPF